MSDDAASKVTRHDCSRLHEALAKCSDGETLRCLYTEYSERMRNRGAHVWTTAAVFIPLSLSGLVVVTNETKCWLFVSSILLIWAWVRISELMRAELERRRSVCAALETAMLKLVAPLSRYGLTELLTSEERQKPTALKRIWRFLSTLRGARYVIAGFVTLLWLLRVVTL